MIGDAVVLCTMVEARLPLIFPPATLAGMQEPTERENTMADELNFEEEPFEAAGTATYQKKNPDGTVTTVTHSTITGKAFTERHEAFIRKLIAGGVDPESGYGKVTGPYIVPTGQVSARITESGRSIVRGNIEKKEADAFQAAANFLGVGLRVRYEHLADGKTRLKMLVKPKTGRPEAALKAQEAKLAAKKAANGETPAPAPAPAATKQAAPARPATPAR